jgi:hypothetical protein
MSATLSVQGNKNQSHVAARHFSNNGPQCFSVRKNVCLAYIAHIQSVATIPDIHVHTSYLFELLGRIGFSSSRKLETVFADQVRHDVHSAITTM